MYIRMASVPRTKTLPMSEYLKLVNKSKSGWRCFFIMQDEVSNLNYYIHNFMERNRNMRNNIDNPDDPDYQNPPTYGGKKKRKNKSKKSKSKKTKRGKTKKVRKTKRKHK